MIPLDFFPEIYLELNPDVKSVLKTYEKAKEHYLIYGINENRIYKYSQIPDGISLEYYFNWIKMKNSNEIYNLPFEGFKSPSSELIIQKIIYGIYFICCIHNYLDIVKEQLNELTNSGLYNDTTQLFLFITLYDEKNVELKQILDFFDTKKKFTLILISENVFEKYAIRNYKKYLTTSEDYYIYYFHTKAASKNDIDNTSIFSKRRQILNFFTLKKYKISINLLEKYDAVGCSLLKYPKTHFSGNFWWSKKSHVTRINDNIGDGYLASEMYICSFPDGKYISLNNETNNGEIDNFIYLTNKRIINNTNDKPFVNLDDEQYIIYC